MSYLKKLVQGNLLAVTVLSLVAAGCVTFEHAREPRLTESRESNGLPLHYPELALHNNWQGTVTLRVTVGQDCKLGSIEIRKSSGHEVLDEAAVRALREKTFGVTDVGTYTFDVKFEIGTGVTPGG